jgi:large subunit ribosomal protein L4
MAEEKDKNLEEAGAGAPEAQEPKAEEATAAPEAPEAVEAKAAEPEAEEAKAAEPEAEEAKAEAPAAEKPKAAKKAKAPAKPAASTKTRHAKGKVDVPAVKAVDAKDAKLDAAVFGIEPNIGVLHEVVRAELAALRRGTSSTKTRGEVRGGGIKPWRQKGTGRARAGSSRIPHWTGGGITFGPKPRSYVFKINRKMRKKALCMALSARVQEGGLKVVDDLPFDAPKTQAAVSVLQDLGVKYPLLVLVSEANENAALSFRNLPRVGVTVARELDVTDIMSARTVLVTESVVAELNERLGGSQ